MSSHGAHLAARQSLIVPVLGIRVNPGPKRQDTKIRQAEARKYDLYIIVIYYLVPTIYYLCLVM